MKNKHFSLLGLIVSGLMFTAVASCEKMTVGGSAKDSVDDQDANVEICIRSYELQPFNMTRADVANTCTKLCFHVYNDDGEKIKYVNQKLEDNKFGNASFSLPKGHYYLIVVGHSAAKNPSFYANEKVTISGDDLGDTFWCVKELEVGDDKIKDSLSLRRIVSMLRFIPTDTVPENLNQMIYRWNGSKGTFDGLTGYGSTKTSQYITQSVSADDSDFSFYMIPSSDRDSLDLKIEAYYIDDEGEINSLREKNISKIPVQRNRITICRGKLFDNKSSNQSVGFKIDVIDTWGSNILVDL
jgi:hypothetical protein